MEIDNKDESADEDNPDDAVCPMDDCYAKTIIQGSVQLFLLPTQFATQCCNLQLQQC